MAMKKPVRIAVTGAAGQIGYQLIFRIAAGDLFGLQQPVILQLLEVTPALGALNGVVMELSDCALPLVHDIVATDNAETAFKDADYAILVGAKPRGPGMERKDLLLANARIFSAQGKALEDGGMGAAIRIANTKSNRVIDATVAGPNLVAVTAAAQLAAR